MATDYAFDTLFRAASPAVLLAAYFDPDHLAGQDTLAQLGNRVVLSDEDTPARRTTSWRVTSQKPLPMYVRPFVTGSTLQYVETMVWRKADDAIDLTVVPDLLGGKVQIAGVYRVEPVAPGQVRRRNAGSVTANVKLLSGKIERGIIGEMEEGVPIMTASTQRWLDKTHGGA